MLLFSLPSIEHFLIVEIVVVKSVSTPLYSLRLIFKYGEATQKTSHGRSRLEPGRPVASSSNRGHMPLPQKSRVALTTISIQIIKLLIIIEIYVVQH